MKRLFKRISEVLRGCFYFWKWPRRIHCHGSILCCQYVDKSNDNQKG